MNNVILRHVLTISAPHATIKSKVTTVKGQFVLKILIAYYQIVMKVFAQHAKP
jgi:hypothetical protein